MIAPSHTCRIYECHKDLLLTSSWFSLITSKLSVFVQSKLVSRWKSMKILFILSLLLLGVICDCSRLQEIEFVSSNLAKSVFEIMEEIFENHSLAVNLLTPESSKSFLPRDFIHFLLLKFFKANVIVRLETAGNIKIIAGRRRRGNVILVEDFKGFLEVFAKVNSKAFRFNGIFLIVLLRGEILEIGKILTLFLELQIYNVNIIFAEKNGSITVKSFIPFKRDKCMDSTAASIGEFKDGKSVKFFGQFFPQKLKNLQKCPVRVSVSTNLEPYIIAERLSDDKYKLSGVDIRVISTLSGALNFQCNYTYVGEIGSFEENETSTGAAKALFDGRADLSISSWLLKANRLKRFDATTSYISDSIVLAIPSGEEFTSLENLIYPFTLQLWLLIFGSFAVGLATIFIVNRQSHQARDFLYGTGVRNPYLNFFIGFIGGSQNVLPKRNFARFILMVYLLYSLIIRTLYQGSFYNLLKANKRHNEVQTVNEMIQKDFKFYAFYGGIVSALQGVEGLEKR